MGLDSVGEHARKYERENRDWRWREIKLSVPAILNVSMSVEKWVLSGYLLKVAANCVILGNQKLLYGSSFYMKIR